jgi:hypothetical protein
MSDSFGPPPAAQFPQAPRPAAKKPGPSFPSTPSYSAPTYRPPAGGFSGGFSGGGGGFAGNPYASGGYSAPSASDGKWQCVVLGVIFMISGGLLLIGSVASIGMSVYALTQELPDELRFQIIIRLVVGVTLNLPLSIIYLVGGSAFVRQMNLGSAKTVAVVACIPCFNCLILTPFGIWAAIIAFGDQGKRMFRD